MKKACVTLEEAIGHHGKLIKYYRSIMNSPHGWTQERLAEAMSVSVRWIQEMEQMPFIQSLERRRALSVILRIPPALLGIENIENIVKGGSLHLESLIVDSLESATNSRWQIYYTSDNQITERGLQHQIEILEQVADTISARDRVRVSRVLAQNYQLAGSLARDNFHYSNAKKYFREAQRLAEEADSVDLEATAVARHGLVLMRQERIEEALRTYEGAINLASHAEPYTKAYIYTGLAEAQARNMQVTSSYRSLETAHKLFARAKNTPSEEDIAHLRFTEQSLQSTQGECYVLVGEFQKGLDFLQNAFKMLDPTMSRRRCRMYMQQAEALLAADQLDYGIEYTLKGLKLAKVLKSSGNIHWASEIHDKLKQSKWRNEPVVGELGAAIVHS